MIRSIPLAPVMAVMLALAGCAASHRTGSSEPFASSSEGELSIFIQNDNTVPVTVRATRGRGGMDTWTVDPRVRRVFSIAWDSQDNLRFRLELWGGRSHTTQTVRVGPGDQVELWIANPVQRSIVRH